MQFSSRNVYRCYLLLILPTLIVYFHFFYFSRNYIFHSIKKKKLFYAIETTNYGIDRLKSIINNFKLIPTI